MEYVDLIFESYKPQSLIEEEIKRLLISEALSVSDDVLSEFHKIAQKIGNEVRTRLSDGNEVNGAFQYDIWGLTVKVEYSITPYSDENEFKNRGRGKRTFKSKFVPEDDYIFIDGYAIGSRCHFDTGLIHELTHLYQRIKSDTDFFGKDRKQKDKNINNYLIAKKIVETEKKCARYWVALTIYMGQNFEKTAYAHSVYAEIIKDISIKSNDIDSIWKSLLKTQAYQDIIGIQKAIEFHKENKLDEMYYDMEIVGTYGKTSEWFWKYAENVVKAYLRTFGHIVKRVFQEKQKLAI